MHLSSHENMRLCIRQHVLGHPRLSETRPMEVLDVGGADENGTYRSLFTAVGGNYQAADVAAGPGVDVVMTEGIIPFGDAVFDVVVCGQVFEHAARFWDLFLEIQRVVKDDGLVIVIAPSNGPVHRFPVDCYRFLPDSMQALAEFGSTNLIESWRDDRGPFNDLVGVFSRTGVVGDIRPLASDDLLGERVQNEFPSDLDPEQEVRMGIEPSLTFVRRVHEILKPRSYLEVGVFSGASLALCSCPAIGIDPAPVVTEDLPEQAVVEVMTSDDYFRFRSVPEALVPLDLSYIDGLHLIENVLMDFMNIERNCSETSVVLIDDIYPNHTAQASRIRRTQHWTGDVWRIVPILESNRPDLLLLMIDTEPTGTLMVLGADPTNNVLWERSDLILGGAINDTSEPPESVIARTGSFAPDDPIITRVLETVRRERSDPAEAMLPRLRQLVEESLPRALAKNAAAT